LLTTWQDRFALSSPPLMVERTPKLAGFFPSFGGDEGGRLLSYVLSGHFADWLRFSYLRRQLTSPAFLWRLFTRPPPILPLPPSLSRSCVIIGHVAQGCYVFCPFDPLQLSVMHVLARSETFPFVTWSLPLGLSSPPSMCRLLVSLPLFRFYAPQFLPYSPFDPAEFVRSNPAAVVVPVFRSFDPRLGNRALNGHQRG